MKANSLAILLLLAMSTFSASAAGAAPALSTQTITTLDTMVVGEARSGPAVWEFKRGTKKVWVLGTYAPLPEGMTFDTSDIETRIAQSAVVVSSPGLVVGDNIGILRGITLWPSIRRKKFNPSGQSLRDILPPAAYAQWLDAKTRFRMSADVDRLRPMYAAHELFAAAAKHSRLSTSGATASVVEGLAEKHRIPWVDARYGLAIKSPKEAIKHFDVGRANDIECLERTLAEIDHFLETAEPAAEAWALGEIAYFPRPIGDRLSFCWAHLTNQAIGLQQGVADIDHAMDERWLDTLEVALAEHDTVFTFMPLRYLIDSTGLADELRRRGFVPALSTDAYNPAH